MTEQPVSAHEKSTRLPLVAMAAMVIVLTIAQAVASWTIQRSHADLRCQTSLMNGIITYSRTVQQDRIHNLPPPTDFRWPAPC